MTRSSALVALLILTPLTAGWSCGPTLFADETRFSLFRHDVAGSAALEPFYYTETFLNGHTADPEGKDYQRNCAEWQAFTGPGVDTADIYTIQYTTGPEAFLTGYNTGRWDSLGKNTLIRWLRRPANREALRYMALAKRAEWTQSGAIDPWGEGRLPAADLVAIAEEAEWGYRNAKAPFLKTRYAFQAVKMWYYATYHTGAPDSMTTPRINALYSAALLGKPTVVAGWAALYHGMVQDDSIAQARSIVRAFDLSEEKKVFAYQQLSREDLDDLLRVEKDETLRAAALAMKGAKMIGPALEELKAVAGADPQSKYLPLLAGREVAKIEDWLLSPEALDFESRIRYDSFYQGSDYNSSAKYDTTYAYYAGKTRARDRAYAVEVRDFLKGLAPRSGAHRTYLLLAVAHLYSIEGKFAEARDILLSLPEPAHKPLRIQRTVGLVLAEMHLEDVTKPAVQEGLLARITTLQSLGLRPGALTIEGDEWIGFSEDEDDLAEVLLLLSRRFLEAGDVVRAGLVYNKASVRTNHYDSFNWFAADTTVSYGSIAYFDRHASAEDVDALLRFKQAKNASAFDAFIAPAHWAPEDFYRDLKGTLIFRQGRYRDALAVFETMPDNFWETTYAYRDYLPQSSIASVGTLLPGSPTNMIHPLTSKKALLREIVALQDSIASARGAAGKARLMLRWGHVQYNTSYYGKAWMLFNYGNSTREAGGDMYEEDYRWAYFTGEASQRYSEKYYRLSEAIAAYREAQRLSGKDKETGAAAALMLVHCDGIAHAVPGGEGLPRGVYEKWWSADDSYYQSPYLSLLRKTYGGTALYQLAAVECPDVAK